ncbi:MAG: S8 family serine peptidase [candidate division Zixibacteria bacterium]|nr:S8 family serine peptidase [candidate division Zixibacteria bacterium]
MAQKLTVVLLALLLAAGFSASAFAGDIASGLDNYIIQNNLQEEFTPVIIVMDQRVDTRAMNDEFDANNTPLAERHALIMTALQETADRTQIPVVRRIEQLKSEGLVSDYSQLWISNIICMSAKYSAIQEIASMTAVGRIYYDAEMELIAPVDEPKPGSGGDLTSVEQGLIAINANDVWAMGITGSGTLVSSLDTGVDGNHPALYDRWRGHDSRYQNNPEWAWHDPLTGTNFPFDDGYHGTHTMGTVCGADNSGGDTVGVAVDAEWISAGVVDRGGDLPTRMQRYLVAFQWTADPDGNPNTMWDVPCVSSNSWGHYPGSMPGGDCDDWYWDALDNLEAMGCLVVLAAGNEGTLGLRNPGVRATDDYNSFAIGAVDGNTTGWPIASFSARGPSYCTPSGDPAIKPEVCAPGVDVNSCYPGGSYTTLSGTSMATPHVAGVVALIKQANPNLTTEMVKQILMDTAYDLGSSGEDNTYGWGMIDAYEAVMVALSYLQGYGVIEGQVTDAFSGDGLEATVTITNRQPPIVAQCNSSGYYSMLVPADTAWNLQAEYPDYSPGYATVTVTEDDTVTQNFQLNPPPVAIDMIPDEYPIYLHPGESFTYTGVLTNQTSMQIYGDVWLMLDVPGIGMYGPLQLYQHVPLAPGQTITVPGISQYVPTFAPIGTYEYIAIAGMYPNYELARTSFDFTVLPEGGAPAEVCILCADYTDNWHGARDLLLDNPNVLSVDFIDVQNSTPSLNDLLAYNVVLVWSNYQFADATALGNVLADFVEVGGGVVTCEFAHYGGWALGGRYMTDYSPMGAGNTGYGDANIVIDDPNHPIMIGVNSGSEYYNFNVPLAGNNPQLLCHYDNGYNGTIVNGDVVRCVALNNYFGDQHASWTGDIGAMMVNAVVYSAANSFSLAFPSPEGYLDAYAAEDENVVSATVVNNSMAATEVIGMAGRGGAGELPIEYGLNDAYPNPFNASAKIVIALPEASVVNLDIYNLSGQKVATLIDGKMEAGYHDVTWDASEYSSGIYFYRMNAGEFSATKRMTLLK